MWYIATGCLPLLPTPQGESSLEPWAQADFTSLAPPNTLCLTPGPGECPSGPLQGQLRGVAV